MRVGRAPAGAVRVHRHRPQARVAPFRQRHVARAVRAPVRARGKRRKADPDGRFRAVGQRLTLRPRKHVSHIISV